MLADAGNSAANAGETITLNLQRLLFEVQTQAKAFQGAGGTMFQNVSAELGQQLNDMLQALNTMAENVHFSNRHFATTDDEAAHQIQQVAADHGGGYTGIADTLRGKH
jgi:uncharacterized protein YukE